MKTETLFVSYKIALQLKEKGFDEPCFGGYGNCGALHIRTVCFQSDIEGFCLTPLYQQVVDWLREKHNLIIEIQLDQTSTVKWAYEITKFNGFMEFERKTDVAEWSLYRDYYEALDYAIAEALKLI